MLNHASKQARLLASSRYANTFRALRLWSLCHASPVAGAPNSSVLLTSDMAARSSCTSYPSAYRNTSRTYYGRRAWSWCLPSMDRAWEEVWNGPCGVTTEFAQTLQKPRYVKTNHYNIYSFLFVSKTQSYNFCRLIQIQNSLVYQKWSSDCFPDLVEHRIFTNLWDSKMRWTWCWLERTFVPTRPRKWDSLIWLVLHTRSRKTRSRVPST